MNKGSVNRRKVVVINGRFLEQSTTGVQRFAANVVLALDRVVSEAGGSQSVRFLLAVPGACQTALELESIETCRVGRTRGVLWEQLELPLFAGNGLILNLCNVGPWFSGRHVTVIHDMAAFSTPANYRPLFRWWYRLLLPRLASTAKRVVTVSRFSASELIRYLQLDGDVVRVVSEGHQHISRIEADTRILDRLKLADRRFFLAVASRAKNKNVGILAKAISDVSGVALVVVGERNDEVFAHESAVADEKILYTGRIADREIRALYEKATGFVFPSLYEGFGLPPIEAMSVGCPVLVSNIPTHVEVCGEAAIYFDPRDESELRDKLLRVSQDVELREKMTQAGLKRAAGFDWLNTGRALFQTVSEVCAEV